MMKFCTDCIKCADLGKDFLVCMAEETNGGETKRYLPTGEEDAATCPYFAEGFPLDLWIWADYNWAEQLPNDGSLHEASKVWIKANYGHLLEDGGADGPELRD